METKKFALSFLTLFAFVILAGSVSADTNFTEIQGDIQTVSHSTQLTISFKLLSDSNETDLELVLPNLFSTSWQGNPGLFNLTENEYFSVELTLDVPEYQDPNLYTGEIDVSNGATNPISLEITVSEDKELSVNDFTAPTESNDGSLTLKNTGNVDLEEIEFTTTGNVLVSFSLDIFDLAKGIISDAITLTITNFEDLKFGLNPTTITATAKDGTQTTQDFTVEKTFCSNGPQGSDLEIKDISIDNKGEGKNDEWQLLDEIEVEVEIKNVGTDNLKDVFVELALFNQNGNDVTSDLVFDNSGEEEFDIGKVNDGDKELVTFRFKVPADMDIEKGYMLAIKTYSDDLKEDNLCDDRSTDLSDNFFESIELTEDPDNNIAVDVDSVIINPIDVICGEKVFLDLNVFNIGGNGEEEQVKVRLRNTELDLDMSYEIRSNMDDGDKESADFSFTIPNGIEAKTYSLEFSTFYDYKSGSYRDSSKDVWLVPLNVISCSGSSSDSDSSSSIFAALESDAVPGEEMTVEVTLINTGSESAIFIIDVLGYESWGDLGSFARSVQVSAGESESVSLTFELDADAEGTESFIVQTTSDGSIETQEVEFSIEESGRSGFTGFSIFESGKGNVWILVLINAVLILLIIFVAIRLSRR